MMKSMFGEETTGTESVLTASLSQKQEFLAGVKPELAADIENSIALVESLIGKQANNLSALFELSKDLDPQQKAQIFENPKIVKAIMETGGYEDNNFSINLADKTLKIGALKPEEISQIQKEFFGGLQDSSNSMGETLESLRQKASKAE